MNEPKQENKKAQINQARKKKLKFVLGFRLQSCFLISPLVSLFSDKISICFKRVNCYWLRISMDLASFIYHSSDMVNTRYRTSSEKVRVQGQPESARNERSHFQFILPHIATFFSSSYYYYYFLMGTRLSIPIITVILHGFPSSSNLHRQVPSDAQQSAFETYIHPYIFFWLATVTMVTIRQVQSLTVLDYRQNDFPQIFGSKKD